MKSKILLLICSILIIQSTTVFAANDKKEQYSKEELENITPGWENDDIKKSEYKVNSDTNTFSNTSVNTVDKKNNSKKDTSKKAEKDKNKETTNSVGPESAKTKIKYVLATNSPNVVWAALEDNTWMLINNNEIKTGWCSVNDDWYYLDSCGIMQTGWKAIDGKWYYFNSNGVMATNTTIDGYYLGGDGAMR